MYLDEKPNTNSLKDTHFRSNKSNSCDTFNPQSNTDGKKTIQFSEMILSENSLE